MFKKSKQIKQQVIVHTIRELPQYFNKSKSGIIVWITPDLVRTNEINIDIFLRNEAFCDLINIPYNHKTYFDDFIKWGKDHKDNINKKLYKFVFKDMLKKDWTLYKKDLVRVYKKFDLKTSGIMSTPRISINRMLYVRLCDICKQQNCTLEQALENFILELIDKKEK